MNSAQRNRPPSWSPIRPALRGVAATFVVTALSSVTPSHATWPLLWDLDSRGDTAIAARRGAEGDLWVLVQSHVQATAASRTVLLRIDENGEIVWTGTDPEMATPSGLAVRADGTALVTGQEGGSTLRATSFAALDGGIEWSRSRADVTWTEPSFGGLAQPIWSSGDSSWKIPLRQDGSFAVVTFDDVGTAQPDFLWNLPSGTGGATSLRQRPGGGFYVAGTFDGTPEAPGWWTLAVDAAGTVLWSHFDDGDTGAGIFSGAFLLDGDEDELLAWANDETLFGVFSVRIWSLDPADGMELWSSSWPPAGTDSFDAHSVVVSGDRAIVAGSAFGPTIKTSALSFDLADGDLVWQREFQGATSTTSTALSSLAGSALVASTLFPPVNPGPSPLWASAWNRDGAPCSAAEELLPARVVASLHDGSGSWYVVGTAFSSDTLEDVLIQRLQDPCSVLFADGFESGDLNAWSALLF
jgi:outer membrane protein assembly factor BamB